MTDLERAQAMMRNYPPTLAEIAEALAGARREGAEAEAERWRGKLAEQCGKTLAAAAQMRERAAQEAARYVAPIWSKGIANAIRALPLTPEEPA